jgi:4-aminobutyrate aminotransferase-like enzyme
MNGYDPQLSNKSISGEYSRLTGHGILYPIVFKTAHGCEITDIEGNNYVDFSSGYGVVNAGWQRRELIEVIREQAGRSCYSVPWMPNREAAMLADKLIRITPGNLQKCIRATGGGDANEIAIKALRSKDRGEILSYFFSYHGGTSAALALGDSARFHFPENLGGSSELKVYPPYCFRCPAKSCHGACSFDCAESIEKILKENRNIRIMILEPVIGSGGIIIPPAGYCQILTEICYRHGIKIIVDEVLTGFGRTGSLFAIDQMGIVPDVLTLSKGMCSGYIPIGAAVMTSELSDHLCKNYNDVTSTYAWTPLACAVALANIDLIINERLDLNARKMGIYLMEHLKGIFDRYLPGETGEIRGRGLMIGVELVKDKRSKEPAHFLGKKIILACQRNGLIISAAWSWNILVFLPPLIITSEEADKGLNILEETLKKHFKNYMSNE